jgi:hypothetical protein
MGGSSEWERGKSKKDRDTIPTPFKNSDHRVVSYKKRKTSKP